jgi:hypothetical protein
VYAWAVPGHEYFFAYYDGSIHMTDDNGHVTTFKILDVRQDATYTYVDTDLGATLPTPTFFGQPANQYVAYPVMTVAETNSGSLIDPPTPPVMIEAIGSTSLVQVGSNYFLYPVGESSGPELSYNGAPVVAGQFGAYVPIAAVQTASGYELCWKLPGGDSYGVWELDNSGNYISNILSPTSGTNPALESLEPVFQQDLNGDGVIGLAVTTGRTLEVPSAYSGPATFMGSSGTLQLDESASFSGTVAGMTGQDTLDLTDINFATVNSPTYSGTSTGGTLTVSDGTHMANLALLGNYLASAFAASSDGHDGTSVINQTPTTADQNTLLSQPHA